MKMISRSDVVFEYRSGKVRQGPPVYVSFAELSKLTGYQSVFGILKSDAEVNIQRGYTKGADYAVYCDTILVDFDDKPAEAAALEERLRARGAAFISADSGGRSVHFHIPCVPLFGEDTTYSVRQWVEQHAPGADLSFYHVNGMFRLFNTIHEKSGRRKLAVNRQRGRAVEIPYIAAPDTHFSGGGLDNLQGALAQTFSLACSEPGVGNRHQTLWGLCENLKKAFGNAPDVRTTVEGILYVVNGSFKNKKDPKDLERILRDVFKTF